MNARPFVSLLVGLVLSATGTLPAQSSGSSAGKSSLQIAGVSSLGERGIQRSTTEIMNAPGASEPRKYIRLKPEHAIPGRENRPQDPSALFDRQWPARGRVPDFSTATGSSAVAYTPQVVGLAFDGVTGPRDTGAVPPDSMGAAGPSQFFIFVNGRLRTFNKATGLADGVINVDPDIFFNPVMTPVPRDDLNSTSDPQIRYDRLSGRWILTIIDTPSSGSSNIVDPPNRLLIAISDEASAGVISASTVWTLYFVQQNTVGGGDTGEFLDYDSLGVDNNALYIGGNMFSAAFGYFITTSGFVIQKNSLLNGGPIVATAFRGLITGGDGPESPRGVDNYDPAANEGYFIGPSDTFFGRLILRRISNPGGAPTISDNIAITVNATSYPIRVDHFGNTGNAVANGRLDALDDRLFAAHIRNGRLWTAHNIAVTPDGIASNSDLQRRDAIRWYELGGMRSTDNGGTPIVIESGTIFDSATEVSSARQYWIPAVMVSGQGHAVAGFSTAGTPYRIDAAISGRLVTDPVGTFGAPSLFTASNSAYNPPPFERRWGDYSFTSVDPDDDMTMWTIQEFCDGTNSYGLEVAKLIAPPPATPSSATASVATGQPSVTVAITGTSISGSGFFDPGAGFPNRIAAAVTNGVVVNSVTYIDPSHVDLDLNTNAASTGNADITVTNPDGQSRTGTGVLNIQLPTAATPSISPDGGAFKKRVSITLSCPMFGAAIYYMLERGDDTTSWILYRETFALRHSATVKAKAVKSGYNDSAVTAASFTIRR